MDVSPHESDAELREILEQTHTIAVVGIKDRESEDAHRIPAYMKAQGFDIVGVNPKLERVLSQPCLPSLTEIDAPIDLVNLWRASDRVGGHVDEILKMSPLPKAVWMQLGIQNEDAAARLRAAGIRVVQDRCIMVEHRRLVARD